MKKTVVAMGGLLAAGTALGQTVGFDTDTPGTLPAAWEQGVTGKGTARWAVRQDASAPSQPNVLQQSGSGAFPWCVVRVSSLENGYVEVKLKALAGKEDQAGGLVWRWKDGDNYYVARANALEGNVRLYRVVDGDREEFGSADVPVTAGEWHTLEASAAGSTLTVSWDGAEVISESDDTFPRGGIGLWSKADSVTAFDDLEAVAQ